MGLDTSHNCWHGPYSSFNRFRHWLANQIGIDLNEYDGYHEDGTKNLADITHDIMPLLNHSDCDGELSPVEAKRVAEGLNDIIENFKGDRGYHINAMHLKSAMQFRDGCLLAANNNEVIDFH